MTTTLQDARTICHRLGLHLTYSRDDDEYRVNYREGREATAYYTNDREDAIGTARDMAARALLRQIKKVGVLEDRREYVADDLKKSYVVDDETAAILYKLIQDEFEPKRKEYS